jgi:hypothetical protein
MSIGGELSVGESDVDVEVVAGVVELGEMRGADRRARARTAHDLADTGAVGPKRSDVIGTFRPDASANPRSPNTNAPESRIGVGRVGPA